MCGASRQEKDSYEAQAAFTRVLTSHYNEVFGQQQGILKSLTDMYQPILAKGPNQEGFSGEEKATLNSQAISGTATNYAHAAKALNEAQAARGLGTEVLPSGAREQERQDLADSAAAEQSREQTEITEANYSAGRDQFNAASGVLQNAANLLNPTSAAGVTVDSSSSAAKTAMDISQQQSSWMAPVAGIAGGVGAAAVGKIKYEESNHA